MPTVSLRRIKDEKFGYDQARHLLNRAGFGGTEAEINALVEMGPEEAVEFLMDFSNAPPVRADQFDHDIVRPLTYEERRRLRSARQSQDEDTVAAFRKLRQERQKRDREQMRKMQEWWIRRMLTTPAPLQEKLVLFWHGHFATSYRTIEDSYHMFMQNQFFRANALGSFADLAYGIVRDPAMLAYLDNNDSRKGKPNENLARELMELFCLGVGNYTENDIKEGARALTGFTFNDDEFEYRHRMHDGGMKHILGSSGPMDGDDFVTAILSQKACAEFIAGKLHEFFTTGPIDPADTARVRLNRKVQVKLAATLRKTGYELRPMLKQLFLSEHFYDREHQAAVIKSPVELVVGGMRTLGLPHDELRVLPLGLRRMGQDIFLPPSVKGWDGGRAWINTSTLFIRQNAVTYLLAGGGRRGRKRRKNRSSSGGSSYDPQQLLDGLADKSPKAVCEYLLKICIGPLRRESHVDVLMEFVEELGGEINQQSLLGLLAVITTMPEYQLC